MAIRKRTGTDPLGFVSKILMILLLTFSFPVLVCECSACTTCDDAGSSTGCCGTAEQTNCCLSLLQPSTNQQVCCDDCECECKSLVLLVSFYEPFAWDSHDCPETAAALDLLYSTKPVRLRSKPPTALVPQGIRLHARLSVWLN